MNSIEAIYRHQWQKYRRRFEQLVKYAQLPFDIMALYYFKTDKSKHTIEIPIIFHPNLLNYATCTNAAKNMLGSYDNLLQLPPVMDSTYIQKLEKKYSQHTYLESTTQSIFYKLPIMLKYHTNGAISWVGIYVNTDDYDTVKHYELSNHITMLHDIVEKTHETLVKVDEFSYINLANKIDFNHSNTSQSTCKFKSLSKAENRCFMAIYGGKYEAKEIADQLHRSVRTIEGLMATMIRKLEIANRYQLFVEVSQAHIHMRYLMNQQVVD